MDRKRQLSNVAFGGAWSEQIAGREARAAAIAAVAAAAAGAGEADHLRPAALEAVEMLCAQHPKGGMLRAAWLRASRLEVAEVRIRELQRISGALAAAFGDHGR